MPEPTASPSLSFGGTEPEDLGLRHEIQVDPHSGTLAVTIALDLPAGRGGFGPQLELRYDSSYVNSVYGMGWSLGGLPAISIDLRYGVPRYDGSEIFTHTGAGELQPSPAILNQGGYRIRYFRPRVEKVFVRVEQWTETATGRVHWRTRDAQNRLVVYGMDAAGLGRIADPGDSGRIFTWLPEAAYDPAGNAIRYSYVTEDSASLDTSLAFERHRGSSAQRYLKRIDYCNTTPLHADTVAPANNAWRFSAVLDYGDHRTAGPGIQPDQPWPARLDPYSSYRAGFEVRTHRLCRRLLLFHAFPSLGADPQLRMAVQLNLNQAAIATTLGSIAVTKYRGAQQATLPPLVFTYSAPAVAPFFAAADPQTAANVPAGLTGGAMQFVDLYGEGLPGILYEQDDCWYYKSNRGGGLFGPQAVVLQQPGCRLRECAIGDFDGDGNPDVAVLHGREAGFYEYDRDKEQWSSFQTFAALPHIEAARAKAQWLDLNGDGRPDLLLADPERFLWFPSEGKCGFSAPIEVELKVTPAKAPLGDQPDIDFLFADMSGDGLADQVLIRNGRVEYWPQTGNGAFGDSVLMENAPMFAPEDEFDIRRVVLANLTGNGGTDLIYAGPTQIRYWLNCGGNQWTEGTTVVGSPLLDRLSSLRVLDFTGDGTPCLVWSSPLATQGTPLQYLPLTDGVSPGRLLTVDNSMGKRVTLSWASSGKHYLRDQAAGRVWGTRLPHHTQVVESMITEDQIGGASSLLRWEYHDGFYDSGELEFRGFSQVDQFDADGGDDLTAPLCVRTWYHPGTTQPSVLYQACAGDAQAPVVPPERFEDLAGLELDEYNDALRALAGLLLRQEMYRVDATGSAAPVPLQVVQSGYRLRRMQPAALGTHACFHAYEVETVTLRYEEQAGDPRIWHDCTFAVDDFGNVTSSCHSAYNRRIGQAVDAPAQQTSQFVVTQQTLLNFDDIDRHETGVTTEVAEFEVRGLPGNTISWESLLAALQPALLAPLDAGVSFTAGVQARRMRWGRTLYADPVTNASLAFGAVGEVRLLHHTENACFTPAGIIATLPAMVDTALLQGSGYVLRDGYWWQPSAAHQYNPAASFYMFSGTLRPDGAQTQYGYDDSWLLLIRILDPLGNVTVAELDYLELAPRKLTDLNLNIAEVQYDPLGAVVVATSYGQMLDANGVTQPYGHAPLVTYNNLAAPAFETILNNPAAALQNAATFLWYDLAAWTASASPPRVIRLVQQDYLQNGSGAQQTLGVPQVRVTYFDGFSRKLQSKLRAEAGEAVARDGAGNLVLQGGQPTEAPAAQRWLVDGHVVFNRKQQVVRQYEPFFTPTAAFEPENILSQYGVSQVTHYDGLGRRLREDFPNGTYATFQFLPWKTTTWDANDNILTSDYRTQRNLLPNTDPEKQALLQTEAHAGTPNISILGPRGMAVRDIHTAAAGGTDLQTNRELDCLDEVLSITDARGIVACRYVKDMTARDLATAAADHGMIQMLPDIYGRIVHQWDARGVHQQRTYDALDRLVSVHVDGALGLNHTVEQRVYGEAGTIANAQLRNLRGQLALHRDSAGVTVYGQFDLKGDLLRSSRQFRTDYKNEANWDDATTVALDPTTYATTTVLDALRRETRQILPDGTTRSIGYLQGGGIVSSQITTPDGSLTNKALLSGMVYNARSQRLSAVYGNGVTVTHAYDPATFRTASIQVQGAAALMDLRYTYDPVGNITWSSDHAQAPPVPGPFLQGINVSPDQAFVYDEFYQLTQATGRVHQSLLQYDFAPGNTTAGWVKGTRHLSLNNGTAVERYTRRYTYDLGGNLTRIRHEGTTSTWNMNMWIAADSNRGLLSTDPDGTAVTNPAQAFDAAGNCLALPNLARVEWNYRGGIAKAVSIDRGGHDPDDAEYYVYDAQGLRVRRVTERLNSGKVDKLERIYLDGCDITRRSLGVTQHLERFTSHVLDGSHRAALVHRWTMDDLALETDDITRLRVRYQLTNHLGSSLMELDENAALITYEEYFPFGGTAFLAGDQDREIAMRDYRFCGKENDDFTGLYYCAARYYAPWMGRWMSADPAGPEDVLNLFCYCRNNPVAFSDPEGLQPESGQVNHIAVTSIPDNIRSRLTASQLRQIEGGGYGWWVKGHTLEVLPNDEVNRRAAAEARRTRQAVTLHDVTGSSNSEGPGTGTASATAGNRPSATPPSPATDGASTTRATGTTGATDPSSPTPQQNNASGAEQNSSHEPPNYSQQPVRSEQSGGGASAGTSSDGATATGGPNGDPNGGSASDPNGVPGQTAAGTQSQSNGSPGQPGNTDGPPGGTNPNGSVDGHPGGDPSGDGTPEDTGTDIDWGTVALSAGKTLLVGAAVILAGAALVAAGIISAPFLAVVGVLALIGIGLHAFFKRANEALDNGQTDRTGQAGLAALGDTVGVTGIYEGATGHDAVTDRTLHTQERSDRLGTGIGSVATVLSASRISRLGTSLGRSGLTASGYSLYDVPSISRPTVRNPLVSGTYQSPEGMLWRANMSNGVRAGWSSWRGGRGFWMGFEGRGGQAVPGAYRGGAGNFWHVRSHFFDIPGRPTHSIFSPDLGQHLVLLGDAPGIAARGANVTVGRLVVEPGSVLPLQSMYPRPNGNPGWFVGTQPPQMPQIGIVGGQAPNAGDPLNFGYRVVTRPGPTAGTNVPVTMYPE